MILVPTLGMIPRFAPGYSRPPLRGEEGATSSAERENKGDIREPRNPYPDPQRIRELLESGMCRL